MLPRWLSAAFRFWGGEPFREDAPLDQPHDHLLDPVLSLVAPPPITPHLHGGTRALLCESGGASGTRPCER